MTKVPLNVRVDPDLRKQLQEIAKRQNRPLSNLVETVLLEFVKETMNESKPG